jgi:hypothetical protein
MLWAHKKTKNGDEDPYVPFYDVNNKTFYEKQTPSIELVKLFSIRHHGDDDETESEQKKGYDASTDLEMYLYKCVTDEMKYLNIKAPLDKFRIMKMYTFKEMVYIQTCSRFCLSKKTTHKSNHVYFVVDPSAGTVHQRCFDDGCRSYKGTLHKLSPSIVAKIKEDVSFTDSIVDDFHSAFAIN